jgi:tRNA(Ile)-lysidine synthase
MPASPLLGHLLPRCQFPEKGVEVACAISGGPDSLALLALAVVAGVQVTAIHVDHGLRSESASEAALVEKAARYFGAAFVSRRVAIAPGPNLEARARRARYDALPVGVLTGHTADDQAETVLLNLLRGAGIDGLAGMRPTGGAARPLIRIRRSETRALCQEMGLAFLDDPSNADHRFTRNRVREQLIPCLADIGHRDPVPILIRQAELLADESAFLDELATAIDPTDARAVAAARPALARRAVRIWLRDADDPERHPPSAAEVERVLLVAQGAVVACQLRGGREVRRSAGRLHLRQSADDSGLAWQ